MENFSAILQTVWRPAQTNSWGGGLHQPPPPDRARVKLRWHNAGLKRLGHDASAGGGWCEHLFISILQLFMFRTLENIFIDRTRHISKHVT